MNSKRGKIVILFLITLIYFSILMPHVSSASTDWFVSGNHVVRMNPTDAIDIYYSASEWQKQQEAKAQKKSFWGKMGDAVGTATKFVAVKVVAKPLASAVTTFTGDTDVAKMQLSLGNDPSTIDFLSKHTDSPDNPSTIKDLINNPEISTNVRVDTIPSYAQINGGSSSAAKVIDLFSRYAASDEALKLPILKKNGIDSSQVKEARDKFVNSEAANSANVLKKYLCSNDCPLNQNGKTTSGYEVESTPDGVTMRFYAPDGTLNGEYKMPKEAKKAAADFISPLIGLNIGSEQAKKDASNMAKDLTKNLDPIMNNIKQIASQNPSMTDEEKKKLLTDALSSSNQIVSPNKESPSTNPTDSTNNNLESDNQAPEDQELQSEIQEGSDSNSDQTKSSSIPSSSNEDYLANGEPCTVDLECQSNYCNQEPGIQECRPQEERPAEQAISDVNENYVDCSNEGCVLGLDYSEYEPCYVCEPDEYGCGKWSEDLCDYSQYPNYEYNSEIEQTNQVCVGLYGVGSTYDSLTNTCSSPSTNEVVLDEYIPEEYNLNEDNSDNPCQDAYWYDYDWWANNCW